MKMIQTVRLRIETGDPGTESRVRIRFNGHELDLSPVSGSTDAGATFEGACDVFSVGHSVFLLGPTDGTWQIRSVVARFEGDEETTNEFGETSLAAGEQLDLLTPPTPTFEV